jgi:hypothetical protein
VSFNGFALHSAHLPRSCVRNILSYFETVSYFQKVITSKKTNLMQYFSIIILNHVNHSSDNDIDKSPKDVIFKGTKSRPAEHR